MPAHPRSRLSTDREAELYEAVLELLVATGYESLTMDAVAQRARTSKATIYRQWQGKPGLVAAALRHVKEAHGETDTGSLRGDLVAIADTIGGAAAANGQLFSAVSHAIQADPELAEAMRECMFEPNSEKFAAVFDRAIARGEIQLGNPVLLHIPGLFLSAILARPVIDGKPIDVDHLVELIDGVILPAIVGTSTPRTTPRTKKRS